MRVVTILTNETDQPNKCVVVISIEGLSTCLVGPYGSNTAITPTLNDLAARGIVLDNCFLDSRSGQSMLVSLWTAQHALRQDRQFSQSLWQMLGSSSGSGVMVTDCPDAAEIAERMGCPRVELVEVTQATQPVQDVDDCQIVALFSQAAVVMRELQQEGGAGPKLCWIHSRGLRQPWDVPIDWRVRMADSDDPEPPSQIGPPGFPIDSETNPDWVVGWGQVAAAQAAAIDYAIDLLRTAAEEHDQAWAWVLIGLQGVPLGEHGWVGWGRSQLFTEELQTAVIIQPQTAMPIGFRRFELTQLPDLAATTAHLLGLEWSTQVWGQSQMDQPSDDASTDWPSVFCLAGLVEDDQVWLRSPAWSVQYNSSDETVQLFAKPDDRWEVNDVSARCTEIVEKLRQLGPEFILAARNGERMILPKLDASLTNWIR